ncbi:helix-turn-helix domain-containing protein [Caenibacillus caldisaponilyticus]|uniref:helix-turn-helix domain-containing protein n=1 Tax=Caenibacillus caldisaponilyticus TaxID=1674942 RepID=UPI00098884A3|nr:helix-turn-helix domain-containing protein [Caenibacillus caldisaponilyticus]
MNIGEKLLEYRRERNVSQREIAQELHIDRSLVSRIESGNYPLPKHHDPNIARLNWKLALTIIDERSGGYISNILDEVPTLDLHPAALKEILLKELDEAERALGELILARHIDPERRKQSAEKVWHEIRDVIEKALVMQGVLEEEFQLDSRRLRLVHEQELKRGER